MPLRQRTNKHGELLYQAVIQPTDPNDLTGRTRLYFKKTWTANYEQALADDEQLHIEWDEMLQEFRKTLNEGMSIHEGYVWYYNTIKRAHHEPRTVQSWMTTAKLLPTYFRHQKVGTITTVDVKKFAMQYSNGKSSGANSSIVKHLVHLKAFFDHAVHEGVIERNPIPTTFRSEWFGVGVRQKIMNRKYSRAFDEILEPTEIQAIRNYFRDLVITPQNVDKMTSKIGILIAAFTGVRPAELQYLLPSDIMWNGRLSRMRFHVHDSWDNHNKIRNGRTKTGNDRDTLYLPDWASSLVRDYIDTRNYYMTEHEITGIDLPILLSLHQSHSSREYYPIDQNSLNLQFKRIGKQLRIPRFKRFTLYWLRHTISTELANNANGKFAPAAALMGNSVNVFMEVYVNSQREAEEALAMSIFD